MSDTVEQNHAKQLEHALATAFTCRSVIKYNSSLSEEQKNELLADIDMTVKFLQEHLVVNVQQLSTGSGEGKQIDKADDGKQTHKLDELYRISQLYLENKSGHGIDEFIARFNRSMAAIDEVQAMVVQGNDLTVYTDPKHVEDLLHSMRGLIADMYAVFMEFARVISNTLQGSGIYIDTEKLSSIEQQRSADKDPQNSSSFLKVYETYLQLNEKKGTLASRIADATAFLIFLGGSLGNDFNKREMVIAQLNKVAKLLNDLSYLLSDYESTISELLGQH